MRKEKKRILPGAAFISLIAAVLVYCLLINMEKRALNDFEKGKVLIARGRIEEGVVLAEDNMGNYFEESQMEKSMIPDAALTEWAQLPKKITVSPLDRGVVLTASMVEDLNLLEDNMKEPVLAGFKAEDLYQVVGGVLRSGDRIHIYSVNPETGQTGLVWENILVREVFNSSGAVIDSQDRTTAAQRVNIMLEKDGIPRFYTELAKGSLRVVKVLEPGK